MIPGPLHEAMQRVNGQLQAGDFRSACDALQEIIETHPDYAEAQRLYGGATLMLGDAAGAERILRRAIERAPDWAPTLTTLGELLLGSGRHAEAEVFLQRAITARQPDPHAARVLARYYNDRRQPARALAVAAPFCAGDKVSPDLLVQYVAALVALGRSDDAIEWCRNLLARSSDNAAAEQALATALQAANRHGEAEGIIRRALERGPRNTSLRHAHARSLIALGEYGQAEAALRDCLRGDPQHVEAHNDLARLVWMRTGDPGQATAMLDDALRRFGGNDALWAARAAVLQGAGDPRAAYACLATRVERPQASPALKVRAGLSALEFDPAIALGLARAALRTAPADAAARTLQVAALLGVGDARSALPECEALRTASPDDQYLIALQTTAWRMLDDVRHARLCDYRNLVVTYPLEPPPPWTGLADFLGDVQRSLGRLHDALAHPLLFQSLRHGTETTHDLTASDDPAIRALFKAFDAPIRDYLARIGTGSDPLRCRNHGGYRFNGSWSVRLHAQGFHHSHVHPRGWISSACYVALPRGMSDAADREGVLTFGEPGIITRPALPPLHDVRPAVGMLVLFPSYFWHGTVPFSVDDARLTVAFDAVPSR